MEFSKEFVNIVYTPETESETKTKVIAKLVLGNFGNYKGTVKIVVPEGTLKDSRNNKSGVLEYTTASIDFKKPEWKEATSTINKKDKI